MMFGWVDVELFSWVQEVAKIRKHTNNTMEQKNGILADDFKSGLVGLAFSQLIFHFHQVLFVGFNHLFDFSQHLRMLIGNVVLL